MQLSCTCKRRATEKYSCEGHKTAHPQAHQHVHKTQGAYSLVLTLLVLAASRIEMAPVKPEVVSSNALAHTETTGEISERPGST
jgi:hypothetical protein